MHDEIVVSATFNEVARFLADLKDRKVPDLDTDAATDAIVQRFEDAHRAARTPVPSVPVHCEGGMRKACGNHPQWRVREKGSNMSRNWSWVCSSHLAAACAFYGESARVDVVRIGA